MSNYIPIKYYDAERDIYRLPDGRTVEGFQYRMKAARRLELEDDKSYDPYNHRGDYA